MVKRVTRICLKTNISSFQQFATARRQPSLPLSRVYIGRFSPKPYLSLSHPTSTAKHHSLNGSGVLHIKTADISKIRYLPFCYLPTQKFLNTSFTTVSVAFSPVKTDNSSIAQSTETFIASVVIPISNPFKASFKFSAAR